MIKGEEGEGKRERGRERMVGDEKEGDRNRRDGEGR